MERGSGMVIRSEAVGSEAPNLAVLSSVFLTTKVYENDREFEDFDVH